MTSKRDNRCGHILPFMFENIAVRGAVLRLENLAEHIPSLEQHQGFGLSTYLSELLAAGCILVNDLKNRADITLQVHSNSPINLMVAQCTGDGHLRAYANVHEKIAQETTFEDIVKANGTFAITVEQNKHKYQSLIALNKDSIGKSVEQYFNESVQLPTYFKVFSGKIDGEFGCGAIFLQALPQEEPNQDDWERLGMLIDTLEMEEILPGMLKGEELLFRLFAEDTVRVFPVRKLYIPEVDNRKRMLKALEQVGVTACKEIIEEDGHIEMACEFTGKTETFNEDDLKSLFGKEWSNK